MSALQGEAFEGDVNGEFSRRMFELEWENNAVHAQVLSMVYFAEHVLNKQGVSIDLWDVLAPVIGASKFNFRYLGEAPNPTTPPRTKSKHVSKRDPRVQLPVVRDSSDESGEEIQKWKKGKQVPPPGRRWWYVR